MAAVCSTQLHTNFHARNFHQFTSKQLLVSQRAYCGTNEPNITKQNQLKLRIGAFYLPKDDPSKPKGEDAHFICKERSMFGVADGVGGWSRKGVDAGEYARELMHNCAMSALAVPMGTHIDPKNVLIEGHSKTFARGSSTACIITLKDNCLYAANLGDSGFVVLRDGKVIFRSPVQQRNFNCPYQIGSGGKGDSPSMAMDIKFPLEDGDIIVAGTDGFFDNMFNDELEQIVEKYKDRYFEDVARFLAEYALYNSFDKYAESPFSKASKEAGLAHKGGKIDDITVVAAFVTSQ